MTTLARQLSSDLERAPRLSSTIWGPTALSSQLMKFWLACPSPKVRKKRKRKMMVELLLAASHQMPAKERRKKRRKQRKRRGLSFRRCNMDQNWRPSKHYLLQLVGSITTSLKPKNQLEILALLLTIRRSPLSKSWIRCRLEAMFCPNLLSSAAHLTPVKTPTKNLRSTRSMKLSSKTAVKMKQKTWKI